MMYLISYDIADNKRRKKIADKLLGYGLERIQYSVFAGPLTTELLTRLHQWFQSYWDEANWPEDRLFILPISSQKFLDMTILGERSFDPQYVAGKQSTLIL